MSCKVGAHSSHTVRSPGSSIALRSALAADSVNLSASSITTTRQPPIDGAQAVRVNNSRTSSIFIDRPSLLKISTSGCAPDLAVVQSLQELQPLFLQTNAWANAIAADERPLPGGPVKIQACVISWLSSPDAAAFTAAVSV